MFDSIGLETITTVHQNGSILNDNKKHEFFSKMSNSQNEVALKADGLCKTYNGYYEAVKDVTFSVNLGEVCTMSIHKIKFEKTIYHFF